MLCPKFLVDVSILLSFDSICQAPKFFESQCTEALPFYIVSRLFLSYIDPDGFISFKGLSFCKLKVFTALISFFIKMSFYLFRRYFFSSRSGALIRLLSWICLAGAAISISALILVVSIMGGFGKAIKGRLLDNSVHLLIHFENNPFNQLTDEWTGKDKSLFLGGNSLPVVFSKLSQRQKDGIKSSVIFERQDLILKGPKGFKGVLSKGFSEKEWNKRAEQGSSLTKFDLDLPTDRLFPLEPQQKKEVLLSHELSLELGLFPGDSLQLMPLGGVLLPPNLPPPLKSFTIKAVLPPSRQDESSVSVYYKQGQANFGLLSKIRYGAEIQLKDPEQVPIYEKLFKKYETQNWMEQNSALFFALKLEKFLMSLFLSLAYIISCLGIAGALLLLINQKGRDIAILQAMGFSRRDISKVFTGVGMYLSSAGIIAGVLIGLGVSLFLKFNRWNILPPMYQDRTLPTVLLPSNYALIIVLAICVAWISCYLPCRYLSRKFKVADLLKLTDF